MVASVSYTDSCRAPNFMDTVVFELSWTCEVITEATVLGVLLACISREKLTVLFIWRGKVELLQETCGLELPTVAIRASDVAAFAAYFHRVGDHAKIHRGQQATSPRSTWPCSLKSHGSKYCSLIYCERKILFVR